jgi:hypothetical protein
MKDCHICECPNPSSLDDYKARITFIANCEKNTPMWEHIVGHVRDAKPTGRKLYRYELPPQGEVIAGND